mmetsp:Transcript_11900/g.21767  ORF Transcript_11900/g.21767 Transcript_11900/m.21767 type:complete len:808 (-) Transcript_11900:113-2536(-)
MAATSRSVDITEALLTRQGESSNDSELAEKIASCLLYKGYCDFDVGCGPDAAAEARLQALRQAPLNTPPAEILSGLLGAGASVALHEMPVDAKGADPTLQQEGALSDFDELFMRIGAAAAAYADVLGIGAESRSPVLLMRGEQPLPEEEQVGAADLQPAAMTIQSCSTWINLFTRQRLLLLAFLGPGEGILQLDVYDGDLSPVTLRTWPGLVVLIRSDKISHKFSSSEPNGVLLSWVLDADTSGPRGGHNMARQRQLLQLPALAALEGWAEQQLQAVAVARKVDLLPRGWQLALQHDFQQGLTAAIRGIGMKLPGSWDVEGNSVALLASSDFGQLFPHARFDLAVMEQLYDPDPNTHMENSYVEGFERMKSACRHGCFLDGAELFDNKMFQLSISEARGMDPTQRWCLECQYEALVQSGLSKKDLSGAYVGVMTGVSGVEWQWDPNCSGVTAASPTINSNRTSFVLGCMGPSFAIDTEMASAASALCCAAESVVPHNASRTDGGLDTIATVATGVYAMIAPRILVRLASHQSPVGRCLSFQSRADGYIKSEGCGSICVRKRMQEKDGTLLVPDEETYGIISGYHMTHSGKTGFNAPNIAVQQQTLANAARHAGLSVLDIDAVECNALGSLLADAVEVSGIPKALRPNDAWREEGGLIIGSAKTNQGCANEAAATIGIFKAVQSLMGGVMPATLHQRQLNAHVDDDGCEINTEVLSYRMESAFHGVSAFSSTGANVHMIFWNAADEVKLAGKKLDDKLKLKQEVFPFWPAGGSAISEEEPQKFLAGSWYDWDTMEPVQLDDENTSGGA